ncbi:hypothetical protein Gotur_014278 [Gossypium turneri]
MAMIKEVNLIAHLEAWWRFRDCGPALPHGENEEMVVVTRGRFTHDRRKVRVQGCYASMAFQRSLWTIHGRWLKASGLSCGWYEVVNTEFRWCSMESYIWSSNAKPDALHFLVALYFALSFPVARFLLDKFIFRYFLDELLESGFAFHVKLQRHLASVANGSLEQAFITNDVQLFEIRAWKCKRKRRLLSTKFLLLMVSFHMYYYIQRLSVWLLSNGSAPLRMNEATQVKITKCSESMWKLTYFATVETWVLKITYYEPWFGDSKGYFKDWPNQELK